MGAELEPHLEVLEPEYFPGAGSVAGSAWKFYSEPEPEPDTFLDLGSVPKPRKVYPAAEICRRSRNQSHKSRTIFPMAGTGVRAAGTLSERDSASWPVYFPDRKPELKKIPAPHACF